MSRHHSPRASQFTLPPRRTPALAGIGAGTLVLTAEGEMPVEHLAVGDRIITRSGARVLRRITSHVVRGGYRIRPQALGQDRPEREIAVGPAQHIHLRDWRARALRNAPSATVAVADLVDGEYISASDTPVRLWRLEFEHDEIIYAGGLEAAVPAPEAVDI